MTSDERALISSLFDRLKQAATQPKDSEADDYIRGKVLEQPSAPYLLVQSTLVMQQALAAAQSRIAGLEKKLSEAASPAQEPGGSFLSGVASLFGVGQPSPQPPLRPVQTPPPLPPQPAAAPGYAPQPIQQAPSRGGGFLQSALSTAAGVAGGALLFQGIENLIGHSPGPFAGLSGSSGGLLGDSQPVVENTEIVEITTLRIRLRQLTSRRLRRTIRQEALMQPPITTQCLTRAWRIRSPPTMEATFWAVTTRTSSPDIASTLENKRG